MRREATAAFVAAIVAASAAFAGPETTPPIGPVDEFNAGLNPDGADLGSPGRVPFNAEQGEPPQTSGPIAAPLPGPALMGAAGLLAVMGIRRRWSDRA